LPVGVGREPSLWLCFKFAIGDTSRELLNHA
jgi:hypothetical protein